MNKAIALFLLSTLALPGAAEAAFFRAAEELILDQELVEDVYLAGGIVTVDQPIKGDLLLLGGDVRVESTISGDVLVGGGEVYVTADVGDDLRIAGGEVTIQTTVAGDLVVVGGEIELLNDSTVAGDLIVLGGEVTVNGTVSGNVFIRGGSVVLNGSVAGSVNAQADSLRIAAQIEGDVVASSRHLHFSTTSAIGGNVTYWQPEGPYYFGSTRVAGTAQFEPALSMKSKKEVKEPAENTLLTFLAGLVGLSLLSAALVIGLVILLTKTYFTDAVKELKKTGPVTIWYGFLYLIVTPFIAVAFCLTFIGLPIGLFIGLLYLFTLFFVKPITAVVFAKWLELHYDRKWSRLQLFFASVGVYVVWKLLALIPLLGTLASVIAVLIGIGTLALTEYKKFLKVR